MAPPAHVSDWMQNHLATFKDYPINEVLCFPGTHDAGMSKITWGTAWSRDGNTVTQSLSIYDQLMHGVRWFDIRPVRLQDNFTIKNEANSKSRWYCGHFNMCPPGIGWQGGTGQSLLDVFENVNRFLKDHPELVVLRLTHITSASGGGDLEKKLHMDLLQLIVENLDRLYVVDENSTLDWGKVHLGDLIGDRKGRVIVTTIPQDGAELDKAVWEDTESWKTRNVKDFNGVKIENVKRLRTDLNSSTTSVTRGQDNFQAFGSFLGKDALVKSIQTLAFEVQQKEFPSTPQMLFQNKWDQKCRVLQIDYVKDDTLLTICLAWSLAGYMLKSENFDKVEEQVIVVYGGLRIMDKNVLRRVKEAMKKRSFFSITRENMGDIDPWPGVRKCCVAYVAEDWNRTDDIFCKARFGWENDVLDFRTEVEDIYFHNRSLKNGPYRTAYYNLYRAISLHEPFVTTLETMGSVHDDPLPGRQKWLLLRYRSYDGSVEKNRKLQENETINFNIDIEWVKYHDQRVQNPDTYEQFFWALDRGGDGPTVTNELMGFDPSPGNVKKAELRFCNSSGQWFQVLKDENEEYELNAKIYIIEDPTPRGNKGGHI